MYYLKLTTILFISISFTTIHAQEVKKSNVNDKVEFQDNEKLILKKSLLEKQDVKTSNLKASSTSAKNNEIDIIEWNNAVKNKIQFLQKQNCCEKEIEKLYQELK